MDVRTYWLVVFSITWTTARQDSLFMGKQSLSMQQLRGQIIEDLSWPLKIAMWKQKPAPGPMADGRRVGIQALVAPSKSQESEDQNMKAKLFRLMYETVRDSDLKVKRAELIKQHFDNSSSFEVGYLMGDISDKFSIMTDIATTLKRLSNEWKPLELINAYEQVANQAIEITHIIDMVKSDISYKFSIMTDIATTLKRLSNEWKPLELINAYEQVANQAIEITHIIDMVKNQAKTIEETPSTPPPDSEGKPSASKQYDPDTFEPHETIEYTPSTERATPFGPWWPQ